MKLNFKKICNIIKPRWELVLYIMFFLSIFTIAHAIRAVLLAFIIDEVVLSGQIQLLIKVFMLLILSTVVHLIAPFYYHYFLHIFSNKLKFNLFLNSVRHINRLPLGYFKKINSAYLANRLIADINAFASSMSEKSFEFIASIVTFLVAIVVGFGLSWQLTLLLLFYQPIYLYFVHRGSKKLQDLTTHFQETQATLGKHLTEGFSGIYEVKSYNYYPFSLIQIGNAVKKHTLATLNLNIFNQLYYASRNGILVFFVFALYYLLAVYLILRGQMTIGTLFAFQFIMPNITGPLRGLTNINVFLQTAKVAMNRILEILEIPQEQIEGKVIKSVRGEIKLKNVSFIYNKKEILKNINITIKSGEKIAIVGKTGVGKTTLVNLLLKYFRPTNGEILIDGVNINDLNTNCLRSRIVVVPQNVFIFNLTLKDNIKIGNPGASDNEIKQVLTLSGLAEISDHLPHGLDANIGEKGTDLSGGERQRIGIARAILKKPDVLIMDEALSQVDSYTEDIVNYAISKIFKEKSVIVIAHRLSTIKKCDTIFVIHNGRLVAQGSHSSLAKTCKEYQDLYQQQFLIS